MALDAMQKRLWQLQEKKKARRRIHIVGCPGAPNDIYLPPCHPFADPLPHTVESGLERRAACYLGVNCTVDTGAGTSHQPRKQTGIRECIEHMLRHATLNPTYSHPEPGATTATATFAVVISLALTSCTGWRGGEVRHHENSKTSYPRATILGQLRPVSLTCTLATLRRRLAKGGQSSRAQTGAAPRVSINNQSSKQKPLRARRPS